MKMRSSSNTSGNQSTTCPAGRSPCTQRWPGEEGIGAWTCISLEPRLDVQPPLAKERAEILTAGGDEAKWSSWRSSSRKGRRTRRGVAAHEEHEGRPPAQQAPPQRPPSPHPGMVARSICRSPFVFLPRERREEQERHGGIGRGGKA